MQAMGMDQADMQTFELGPDFLASMRRQLATDQQVVRAVADVVTGREFARNYRQPHLLRYSSEAHGNARGWRCNVSRKSGGPRLLWYRYPNGGIELIKITDHDHADLP